MKKVILVAAALTLGFLVGSASALVGSLSTGSACDDAYTLLNPYLRCESGEELRKSEYTGFKDVLAQYIRERTRRAEAISIAVYFRDLENGPWFGIEEDALFSPASMLKLPLLVAYYKEAEQEPRILAQEIEVIGSGESHTIDDLLHRVIVESDNAALPILFSYLKQYSPEGDLFAETLAAMGIAKSEGSVDDFLTVKRYAAFYRSLYNASFLSKEMSQRALELLTRTRSPEGIDDAVPAGVPVAHKFGIRVEEGIVQIHDCGIVYHARTPYLLCIMTKGHDQSRLSTIIREIAEQMYAEVDRRS